MLQALTAQQSQWVDKTLSGLSLEQAVGQLLSITYANDRDFWFGLMERVQFGACTVRAPSAEELRAFQVELQAQAEIPLLIVANMEHGATDVPGYGTDFPWPMAMGAANDESLMVTAGQAVAMEARYLGINWVFSPTIDLNYNFNNPVTNIRALGDNPDHVSRLATVWLQAMQQYGVAATAKHFPGDGIDDRDQHLVTTINSMPFDQWKETYGVVWKAAIDAGVWCIMPGHISLPDYQGYQDNPEAAPPATLSRKILVDLLREELGYEGLIVSDSTSMIGLTSRAPAEELVVQSIASGIDIYLGADPDHDFDRLLGGVQDGRIPEAQIYASAQRVLEMKARLNLFEDAFGPQPTPEQTISFKKGAQAMADKSITVLRSEEPLVLDLASGDTVLTVTYGQLMPRFGLTDLNAFDQALRDRGLLVEHLLNPTSDELRQQAQACDVVFINLFKVPMMPLGAVRMTDTFPTWGWRSLYRTHPNVVYSSFGNPYVLYEIPTVPRLIAAYGNSDCSQQSAVKVWLGEIDPTGTLPVQLPKVEIKRWPIE